jgi:hypothetical protein
MSEQIARYKPGQSIPGFANAQVNAGRFVNAVATKTANGDFPIEHAAAKAVSVLGVAEQDSGPTSQDATSVERRVAVVRRPAIARVQAGAEIIAGEEVGVGANGKAVKAEPASKAEIEEGKQPYKVPAVGRCLTTVLAEAFAEVDLY